MSSRVEIDHATSALAFVVAFDNTVWWSDVERWRLEAFHELRKALAEASSSSPDAFFRALGASLQRAERHPGREQTLVTLEPDGELRDLVAAVFAAERRAADGFKDLLLGLDARWGGPEIWERLAKAVAVPPASTEVVYVYRNVNNGARLQYRELSREELRTQCSNLPLRRCLEPGTLARIFRR